ncbi:aminotransferase class I/II-fold pyridoxal phosphate-dependent enzyme [Celeribacter sp. ULVN23_4]
MFKNAQISRVEPVLELIEQFHNDPRTDKIDLSIGVYRDEEGHTPVMAAVHKAETALAVQNSSKEYGAFAGSANLLRGFTDRFFPERSYGKNVMGLQTVGGSAALRILIETAKTLAPQARLWVPKEGWANHVGIAKACGFDICHYDYLGEDGLFSLTRMLESLSNARAGDIIVYQLSCHNPTGVDATKAELSQIAEFIRDKELGVIIDAAYLGFDESYVADLKRLEIFLKTLPEVMLALSFSKSFGIYNERLGAAYLFGDDETSLANTLGLCFAAARTSYSFPAAHGARVVDMIFSDIGLFDVWQEELRGYRTRIKRLRTRFAAGLRSRGFGEISQVLESGSGMFALLPINALQAEKLKKEFGIYVLPNGRLNIACLPEDRIEYIAASVSCVLAS